MSGFAGGPGAPPLLRQRWQTINPAHAVQRVAVEITFPDELPLFLVNKTRDAVRDVVRAMGLVKEETITGQLIQLGPSGAQPASAVSSNGTVFQDVRSGQVVQALSVTRQAVRFETHMYTRWVGFRAQLQGLLDIVLPMLSGSTNAQSIGLEYIDFFFAMNEGAEDAGAIIDRKSAMIAHQAFSRREPFHSHSGWFGSITDISRHLIQVDLTVTDAAGPVGVRRAVTIRTFESEQVTDTSAARASELLQPVAALEVLDRIHIGLKKRLGEILTRDAQQMISLGS